MSRDLHYTISGPEDEAIILFLHGFMGSSNDWKPIIEQLDDRWRCVAVDLPGQGNTPVEGFETFDDILQALIDLVDSLHGDYFHVVGYSMGGRLAFMLMDRIPKRLMSSFVISASPGILREHERAQRIESDEKLAARLEEEGLDSFLDFWYELPLFRALHWHPEQFRSMLLRRKKNDPAELAAVLRRFGTGRMPNCWEIFKDLNVRLSYIAGDVDDKYCQVAEEIDWLCPEANVAIIPGCGHTVHVEEPECISSELRRWLDISEVWYEFL